jgi:uncharacterized protein YndB with AHSA1/START domain
MTATTDAEPADALRGKILEVEGSIASASEIEIAGSAESVWHVLTDFDRWPDWNPDVMAMLSDSGELAEGFVFRWKAGPSEIASTVAEVRRPHRIVWHGKTLGISAQHVWNIDQRGAQTFVHTEEAFSGLVAQILRIPLRRELAGGLDRGLVHLKREVERRANQGVA